MKKDVIRLSIKLGILFLAFTAIFCVTYFENAELAKELLEPYMDSLGGMLEEDGSIDFVTLWLNNLFVCVKTIGMGLMPVIYLPILVLFSNATVMGTVLGLAAAESGYSLMDVVLYSILPHGIFEITALCLTFGLGFYLCRFMTRRLFGRGDGRTLLEVMNSLAKAYVLVVIPLLTVAALIECYVTPEIMAWAGIV